MPSIASLIDTKNALIKDAMLVVERGLNVPANRDRHTEITAKIDAIEDQLSMQRRVSALLPASVAPPAPAPATRIEVVSNGNEERARMTREWRSLFSKGQFATTEYRDLATGTDSTGAALIPRTISGYAETLKAFGPIGSLVSVDRVASAGSRRFTTYDDTESSMVLVGQGNTVPSSSDASFTTVLPLDMDSLVASRVYSYQEAADVPDFDAWLTSLTAPLASRSLTTAIMAGTDNTANANVLPNSPAGGLLGSLAAPSVTGVSTSGFTLANLNALRSSVNAAYRTGPSAGWLMSQASLDFAAAMTDSTGRPLFNFNDEGNLMILGNVAYLDTNLPDYDVASSTGFSGTVTTNGTAVAWVSGSKFNYALEGESITINSVAYTVASVTNKNHLVLTTSAGVQSSAVAYTSDVAVSSTPILFGDYSKFYRISTTGIRVRVVKEAAGLAESLLFGTYVYQRLNAAPLIQSAVASLATAS
jgi:HK97 family phage major capsid protein